MTTAPVILCADDYAMTAGVSRGILELAQSRRLSATSALVTLDRWPEDAKPIAGVRDRIAVGLHIDLTLGRPLGPMPSLAPEGRFPNLRQVLARALTGRIDQEDIAAEVTRQLDRFEDGTGFPPDHVDGHQHVHALPAIRHGVLKALARRFPSGGPLVRDPADSVSAIRKRGLAVRKSIVINLLSSGFAAAVRARGFAVNDSFAGTSPFKEGQPYGDELTAAFSEGGRHHLVMCHPGHVDPELSSLDPVVIRRAEEYAALAQKPGLPAKLWYPERASDGPPVVWQRA
ncbi:MAG: ChbG/HpnK family deacetylase [Hyphomicrobiaceae bacterium]